MWPFSSSPIFPELAPAEVGVEQTDGLPSSQSSSVYDYIIVGGGTAGCVLANRLSEDENVTVLLVERGAVNDTWSGRVPLISTNFARKKSPNYAWDPLPQKGMEVQDSQADMRMISGKALGGTSRINSMLYTRGGPEYNAWAKMGRKGWSFDDLYPYFLKSESARGALASRSHHGNQGVWQTRSYGHYYLGSYIKTVDAAAAVGLPFIADINSPHRLPFGCADIDVTIDSLGQRHSTYHAFLPVDLAIARQARLKIVTSTIASKILFDKPTAGGTPRALGVVIEHDDATVSPNKYVAQARREIILCSGAIGSPHLLQLSGIGPATHLREMGVDVVKDLPGVGSNLEDHFGTSVSYLVPLDDSFHALQEKRGKAVVELLKYLVFGWGIFLAPIVQLSIFVRSDLVNDDGIFMPDKVTVDDPNDPSNVPDIEIMPIPTLSTGHDGEPPPAGHGILSFLTVLAQPKSRGSVRLLSLNPRERPACDLAYFTSDSDWAVVRKGLKLALAMGDQMQKSGYKMTEHRVLRRDATEEEFRAFVKRQARTTYHYSSTCRMAPENDPVPGVVDDELRVHGITGLRIADASIFPHIIATHLQAPAVVVAEKCADMIKAAYVSNKTI